MLFASRNVIIGEAGGGKTAIAKGLAQRIMRGEVLESLKNRAINGEIDAANLLKPMLSRCELRCIRATTLDEYKKYNIKDSFNKYFVINRLSKRQFSFSVDYVSADGGRRKRVKCYVQGSGRRKRKKVIGRGSGSLDSTRISQLKIFFRIGREVVVTRDCDAFGCLNFSGDDPDRWVFAITKYFSLHNTPADQRLRIVGFNLEGATAECFRWMSWNGLITTWDSTKTYYPNDAFSFARITEARSDDQAALVAGTSATTFGNNGGDDSESSGPVTPRAKVGVEGSLEEAMWEWMSDSQSASSLYHLDGKVILKERGMLCLGQRTTTKGKG
nr:chaperone protein ClpB3, chloroplastic-like [Tanacetum cinerariifolium]